MSRSYRRPYSAITGVKSAHDDKTVASRRVRRTQNRALQTAFISGLDWDEFLIPDIYECADNDVWGWGRDGNQSLQERGRQYNNPFAYICSPTWMSLEEIMANWEDSKHRDDEWLACLKRK